MLRNHPLLGRGAALLILSLYLACMAYIVYTYLPASTAQRLGLAGPTLAGRSGSQLNFSQKLLITTNGGDSWKVVSTQKDNILSKLYCPGPQSCYATGQAI